MSTISTDRVREANEKRARLDAFMDRNELDGVLLTRQSNFAWATAGGTSWVSTATEFGVATLLFFRDGRRYALLDNIEAGRLASEELDGLGIEFVETPWWGAPPRHEQVARLPGGAGARLASDVGWPGARDMGGEIQAERFLLTTDEAERYRAVGRLAGEAIEQAAAGVAPGMTEWQVAARLAGAAMDRGLQPFVTLVASDERALAFRHPVPTARRVERYALLVLCARGGGLVGNCSRLVHVGAPPADLLARLRSVQRVDATVTLSTAPGARMGDLFGVIERAYADEGMGAEWERHHQGGATGYEAREYVATPGSEHRATERQAFAWNPSAAGVKSEDTVLISPERGLEVLTRPPGSTWPSRRVEVSGLGAIERPEILTL